MPYNPNNPRGPYRKRPLAERFWGKTIPEPNSGCLLWLGPMTNGGYGMFSIADHEHMRTQFVLAHRFAWTITNGEIPAGLDIDHLCRNRACVNPAHLEPVSHRENVLRGEGVPANRAAQTHCKRGHLLQGDNLYRDPRGSRRCRACIKEQRHGA